MVWCVDHHFLIASIDLSVIFAGSSPLILIIIFENDALLNNQSFEKS